jgi:hypothetical protein
MQAWPPWNPNRNRHDQAWRSIRRHLGPAGSRTSIAGEPSRIAGVLTQSLKAAMSRARVTSSPRHPVTQSPTSHWPRRWPTNNARSSGQRIGVVPSVASKRRTWTAFRGAGGMSSPGHAASRLSLAARMSVLRRAHETRRDMYCASQAHSWPRAAQWERDDTLPPPPQILGPIHGLATA